MCASLHFNVQVLLCTFFEWVSVHCWPQVREITIIVSVIHYVVQSIFLYERAMTVEAESLKWLPMRGAVMLHEMWVEVMNERQHINIKQLMLNYCPRYCHYDICRIKRKNDIYIYISKYHVWNTNGKIEIVNIWLSLWLFTLVPFQ